MTIGSGQSVDQDVAAPVARAGPEPNAELCLIGGNGDVGRRLARLLMAQSPARVTVMSRHAPQQSAGAAKGPRFVALDIRADDAAERIPPAAIVVNLTEATPPDLVRRLVEDGAVFIETSASPAYLEALEAALADTHGPGLAVLCVGVAPGLTNLLAVDLIRRAPNADRIDIAVEMGLGRHYGLAATEWFLRTAGQPYPVVIDGTERLVRAGQMARRFEFAPGERARTAIGYGFAEQRIVARAATGAPRSARSFVALDPPWMTQSLSALLGLRLGPAMARHARGLTTLMSRLPGFGRIRTRLAAEATGADGQVLARLRVATDDQAEATAAMILAVILSLPVARSPVDPSVTTIDAHLSLAEALQLLEQVLPNTRFDGPQVSDFQ